MHMNGKNIFKLKLSSQNYGIITAADRTLNHKLENSSFHLTTTLY